MTLLSSKTSHKALAEQNSVCERLGLLLDILIAHKDLCERLEKGLHNDHTVALSKLLSLKKRKIQGVIRGTDVRNIFKFCLYAVSTKTLFSTVRKIYVTMYIHDVQFV